MLFIGSPFVVLLSLFTVHQLGRVSSHPNPGPDNTVAPASAGNPFEKGHGPQVSLTPSPNHPMAAVLPAPPAPPRLFAWDRKLHIDRGNVVVVNLHTGEPAYTISQSPQDHRTTIVSNIHGDQLLSVRLKVISHLIPSLRRDCSRPHLVDFFSYQQKTAFGRAATYDTPSGVHYTVDPRMALTDHWDMVIEGKQPQTLKYFRGRNENTGNVYFEGHNQTKVASFNFVKSVDKSHWAKDNLGNIKKIVTLEITSPTDIADQYFLGLWVIVKRRMDRFGA
ncbi:hypothetical protein PGTUg99_019133 [Puccinia graminis f. sp. tritici]|uniref:Uncharacterized protein n=1 Tax=Puccinia graminis f. sp. tritici TaxID=56615 RepID=A0A5B0S9U9_PUCGR|nr:hypothetical protein PGTUg99_019133 [Puccinia graminis f. sp. tritici]